MLREVSTVSTESNDTTTSLPRETITPSPRETITPSPRETITHSPRETITHSPRETLIPDDSVNSTGANPNDNGNSSNVIIIAAGILVPVFIIGSGVTAAIITGISCHRKKQKSIFLIKNKRYINAKTSNL